MSDERDISVLLVEPGKKPKLINIKDDLKAYQDMVGGYIEVLYPFEDEVAYCKKILDGVIEDETVFLANKSKLPENFESVNFSIDDLSDDTDDLTVSKADFAN